MAKAKKTLYARVSEDTHRRVRVTAAQEGVSLREWVERAVKGRLELLRLLEDGPHKEKREEG